VTWIKLVDTFPEHPKALAAGDQAGWLYVCGLCYCSRHLTDGFIPESALSRLTGLQRPARLADQLVRHGLWARVDDGWRVHDYEDHQRTRDDVDHEREGNRERQRRRRASRRDTSVSHSEVTGPELEKNEITPKPPNGVTRPTVNPKVQVPHVRAVRDELGWSQQPISGKASA
jgi:hypothetical protein